MINDLTEYLTHWLTLDGHFHFAFVDAQKNRHTTHIVERANGKALCGQNNVADKLPVSSRPTSLICKRCQTSYWRRYEKAMRDL